MTRLWRITNGSWNATRANKTFKEGTSSERWILTPTCCTYRIKTVTHFHSSSYEPLHNGHSTEAMQVQTDAFYLIYPAAILQETQRRNFCFYCISRNQEHLTFDVKCSTVCITLSSVSPFLYISVCLFRICILKKICVYVNMWNDNWNSCYCLIRPFSHRDAISRWLSTTPPSFVHTEPSVAEPKEAWRYASLRWGLWGFRL